MVLSDLGRKLNAALSSFSRIPVVDEKVLSDLLYLRIYLRVLGSRYTLERSLRSAPRVRCQRQTGVSTPAKSPHESEGCIRKWWRKV